MITVVKQTTPAGKLASAFFPAKATTFVIFGGREIDAILEQIEVDGESDTVAALLVPQSHTFFRGSKSIAEGDVVALLFQPENVLGNSKSKLGL